MDFVSSGFTCLAQLQEIMGPARTRWNTSPAEQEQAAESVQWHWFYYPFQVTGSIIDLN
jgi:hypothetical protein